MDNTYRYERKFILPKNYSVDSIESVLIKSRFSFTKQHEDRYVNSIYFDNKNLDSVKENLDGVVSKKKIRLRWYGSHNLIQNPRLEVKLKMGYLNTKKIFELKNLEKGLRSKEIQKMLINNSPSDQIIKILKDFNTLAK